jgi:pimeloyl-ACP methyl ester carboxylesterase
VLGITTHAVNNEGAVEYDGRTNRDMKAAVDYLYDVVGVEKVVLLGHSGGGNTISLYQAVAENGLSVCQGSDKVVECSGDPSQIGRPADALMFMDSNVGTAINMLRRWNPAVIDESNPRVLDPALNPWLESNGYNPNGCSAYSEEFQQRYFEAQAQRVSRLTAEARRIQQAMDAGVHIPTDNDKFVAYRINARLYDLDNTIDAETKQPRKLVKDDGQIVTEIVQTVRPCGEPLGYSTPDTDARLERTRDMNVRTLLGIWSISARNSMYDIDICSANGSTMCMVQHIRAPSLFTASQGNPYVVDNETMYELSGSAKKDYVVIEGATHGMDNCSACDGAPYYNVRKNFFDYLATWINGGFEPVASLPSS